MFIHAFSTEMIQIQGKKHMKIKAIQVEKEAFICGYFPRWPVIPGKHFSLIKKRKKQADPNILEQPGRQMHHS